MVLKEHIPTEYVIFSPLILDECLEEVPRFSHLGCQTRQFLFNFQCVPADANSSFIASTNMTGVVLFTWLLPLTVEGHGFALPGEQSPRALWACVGQSRLELLPHLWWLCAHGLPGCIIYQLCECQSWEAAWGTEWQPTAPASSAWETLGGQRVIKICKNTYLSLKISTLPEVHCASLIESSFWRYTFFYWKTSKSELRNSCFDFPTSLGNRKEEKEVSFSLNVRPVFRFYFLVKNMNYKKRGEELQNAFASTWFP